MAYARKSNVAVEGGNLCPQCKIGTLLPSLPKFGGGFYCSDYRQGCKYKQKFIAKVQDVASEIAECLTLSEEQRVILNEVKANDNNIIISALAGTGKTFEMVQCVKVLAEQRNKSVLCLAFAKRDQIALTAKVAGKAEVKTSNGAGHSILMNEMRQNKWGKLDLDQYFAKNLLVTQLKAEGLIPEQENSDKPWGIPRAVVNSAVELVDKARNVLPLNVNAKALPNDKDWEDLLLRFGIELREEDLLECYGRAAWLFKKLCKLETLKLGADFTQQIFLPSYHNLQPKEKYDYVLIDEYQDQNYPTRQIGLLYAKDKVGRFICVGDKNQAIYAWRGADKDSIAEGKLLIEKITKAATKVFPLTECRRCSKAVIYQAQQIVPTIKALPDAIEGFVGQIGSDEEFIEHLKKERKGLVLCRANAPSVTICLKLLANGIPAAMVRSDVVHQLLKLIDKCSPDNGKTQIADMLQCVNEWQGTQLEKLSKYRSGEKMMQTVRDKVEVIQALALAEDVKVVGDLKQTIDKLFPAYAVNKKGISVKSDELAMEERAEQIVLFATVHGAKGEEADTVYLYSPATAKACLWDQIWLDEVDRDNICYTALTRSKNRLFHVGLCMSFQRFSPFDDLSGMIAS